MTETIEKVEVASSAEITIEATGEFETKDDIPATALLAALESLKEFKPGDRSETDRHYAVTITMVEQAYAYFLAWVY